MHQTLALVTSSLNELNCDLAVIIMFNWYYFSHQLGPVGGMEMENEAIDDLDLDFTSQKPGASQKPPAEKLNTKGIYFIENNITTLITL